MFEQVLAIELGGGGDDDVLFGACCDGSNDRRLDSLPAESVIELIAKLERVKGRVVFPCKNELPAGQRIADRGLDWFLLSSSMPLSSSRRGFSSGSGVGGSRIGA